MPYGDGTGPLGQGPRTGRGMGRGRGRMRANYNLSGGYCVCPSCGGKLAHQAGIPCSALYCPNCGERMVRQE